MRSKLFRHEVCGGAGLLEESVGDSGEDCDVGDSLVGVGELTSKVTQIGFDGGFVVVVVRGRREFNGLKRAESLPKAQIFATKRSNTRS